jgi:CheY-like chemotaxis protein
MESLDSLAIVSEPPTEMPVGDVIGTRRTGASSSPRTTCTCAGSVARALRTTGYRVVEAADGVEVLSRIESTIWHDRHDVIRAVVADMNMPGLTGLDVLAALRCARSTRRSSSSRPTATPTSAARRGRSAPRRSSTSRSGFGELQHALRRALGARRGRAGAPRSRAETVRRRCPNGTEHAARAPRFPLAAPSCISGRGHEASARSPLCRGCASSSSWWARARRSAGSSASRPTGTWPSRSPTPGVCDTEARRHHGEEPAGIAACAEHGCTDIAFSQPALRSSHDEIAPDASPSASSPVVAARVAVRVDGPRRPSAVSPSDDAVRARRSVVLLV